MRIMLVFGTLLCLCCNKPRSSCETRIAEDAEDLHLNGEHCVDGWNLLPLQIKCLSSSMPFVSLPKTLNLRTCGPCNFREESAIL